MKLNDDQVLDTILTLRMVNPDEKRIYLDWMNLLSTITIDTGAMHRTNALNAMLEAKHPLLLAHIAALTAAKLK